MVLIKAEKSELRATIFRHLDGIGVGPTAFALYEAGILAYLTEKKK